MSARAVAAPQCARDLPAWRQDVTGFQRGKIPGLLAAVADAVQRGTLAPGDPRTLALIERRVEDLRPIDDKELRLSLELQWAVRIATDVALWSFLAEPGEPAILVHLEAWGSENALAQNASRRELGYALWTLPNELHVSRMSVEQSRHVRAIVRRYAVDYGTCFGRLSEHDLLARDLERERWMRLGFYPHAQKRGREWEVAPSDGPPYRGRRYVQAQRRFFAERRGTPWPEGRGRRPGAEGAKAAARRAGLRGVLAASRDRPVGELVAEHAARHGVSRATAYRDLRAAQRG
jgi:hypothetical protein